MTKKSEVKAILPWDNKRLEQILLELIAHGTEASKVDFKAEIELNTPEQKSEVLKDISAMANTHEDSYEDHGFIVYGVKSNAIEGVKSTEFDAEKLQNTIEQLLKEYIAPMPSICVVGFETEDGKKWGAIVILPRNVKPYMFFKQLTCSNPRFTRTKGEWFIRRGSTTDPGLPEDLARISQRQIEIALEPLYESMRSIQSRVTRVEEEFKGELFKLVKSSISKKSEGKEGAVKKEDTKKEERLDDEVAEMVGMSLPDRFKQKLRRDHDPLEDDLITAAKELQAFIEKDQSKIPWIFDLGDAEKNRKAVELLEEKTRDLLLSIATILRDDDKGRYHKAILRAVKILAKTVEPPTGISYTRMGVALRYYPLGLIIYTVFICAAAAGAGGLLKDLLEIPLKHPKAKGNSRITDIFYYWYDAKALFNNAFVQRWCEPIAARIRQVFVDLMNEMNSEAHEAFFQGEFLLALTRIDADIQEGNAEDRRFPFPGLYLYLNEAADSITEFLTDYPAWFTKIYRSSMDEILKAFDRNSSGTASPGCITSIRDFLSTQEVYKKTLEKRNAS